MEGPNLLLPGGRPLWQQPALWNRLSGVAQTLDVETEAVRLEPGDPRPPRNDYILRLGTQRLLHEEGRFFFDQVRRRCDFDAWCLWDSQEKWLEALFRKYFGANDDSPALVSLVFARRPTPRQKDPTIQITQEPARPRFLRDARHLGSGHLEIGSVLLPQEVPCFAGPPAAPFKKRGVYATFVPRRVASSKYGIVKNYEEIWVCLGEKGADEKRLRKGQIPAVPESHYQGRALQVRSEPMLNLIKVNPAVVPASYTILTVEVSRFDGAILSLRLCENAMAAALLHCSPVEHQSLCEAFRRLVP